MATELEENLRYILSEKETKIIAANILKGVTILGVEGIAEGGTDTTDATATSEDIIAGKTAYVNGEKIEGIIPNNGELNYTPSNEEQTIPEGYTSGGIVQGDSNLVEDNIKSGITIFGVTGILEEGGDIKQFATVEEMNVSEGNEEGDLALVYQNEINYTYHEVGDVLSPVIAINKVVLPEQITEETTYTMITKLTYAGAISTNGTLNAIITPTSAILTLHFDGVLDNGKDILGLEYTSKDGITYVNDYEGDIYEAEDFELNVFGKNTFGTIQSIDGYANRFFAKEFEKIENFEGAYQYKDGVWNKLEETEWKLIKSQLTLDNSNQLVNGVVGYGKNGLIEGSIINHTDLDVMVGVAEDGIVLNDIEKTIQFSSDDYPETYAIGNGHSIGIHMNYDKLASEIGISDDKILKGNTILGVEGTLEEGIDTTDATATSKDIVSGKTAYVNGEKIEGNIIDLTKEHVMISVAEDGVLLNDTEGIIKFSSDNYPQTFAVGNEHSIGVHMNYDKLASEIGLSADKILKGNTILNINGVVEQDWDTTQIRYCSQMFMGNNEMVEAPYFDTRNVTIMNYMFHQCSSLITVPQFDTTNVKEMQNMFNKCIKLTTVPKLNTSNVTYFNGLFMNCISLKTAPEFDTSNATGASMMFDHCELLETVPTYDFSKVNNVYYMFNYCINLNNLGGLLNLGKGYTATSNNYSNYKLSLSTATKLTHDSLMNIINNLYDLNLTYDVANGGTLYTQGLVLGSTNLAKLTAEEIAIATNKGWTVS